MSDVAQAFRIGFRLKMTSIMGIESHLGLLSFPTSGTKENPPRHLNLVLMFVAPP